MKRLGNIFHKIVDIENIKQAHINARKKKTYYKEVKIVDEDLENHLKQTQDMLINKTYKIDDYDVSVLNDKGKERVLHKLTYYPHRIIQWAIMLQIEQEFTKNFCYHTCASVPNRGINRAFELAYDYVCKRKFETYYCLKIDVKKFYPNINKEILKQKFRKLFKDKDLLWLLDLIVDSFPEEKGVPIGSYCSQYFANFYLSEFDHWLKETKKMKYVIRYMDDIVIFSHSKELLHNLRKEIQEYWKNNLKLKMKENYQVFPVHKRGVDFVGYRFFPNYILLRKSSALKMKRKCNRLYKKQLKGKEVTYTDFCSINSYTGFAKYFDHFRLWNKYISKVTPFIKDYYKCEILNPKLSYKKKERKFKNYCKKFDMKKYMRFFNSLDEAKSLEAKDKLKGTLFAEGW